MNNKDPKSLHWIMDGKQIKNERKKNEDKWKALYKQAQNKNSAFREPAIPYTEVHIVGEHNGLDNGNVVTVL